MIVEDGTGLSNADSYVDLVYANAYFSDRNNAEWGAITDDTVKESLLIKATDYIEAVYYNSWIYDIYSDTQSLSFPRIDDDKNIIVTPDRLKKAVCELALKANTSTLLEDISQRVTEESVGSITVKYADFSNQQKQYSNVYALVKPYLVSQSSFSIPLVRV